MKKRLIIVGGGIAGLSAGVYALQSGFETSIIEGHAIPGGNCTSWKRQGYLFEGAIHWMCGTSPEDATNMLWRETGALNDGVRIYNHEPYLYTNYEGTDLFLYRDINRLKGHFMEISPGDKRAIQKLIKDIKAYCAIKKPVQNEKGVKLKNAAPEFALKDMFTMLPGLVRMGKHMKISTGEYVKMFQHDGIRRLLVSSIPPYLPAMAFLFFLAVMANGDGGYPEGGSLAMTQRMADTFKNLGGTLSLNTKVQKVIIENGKVKGVKTDKNEIDADAVIIASDTITAVDTLFETALPDEWIKELKQEAIPCVCTFAGIGVRSDLSRLPHSITVNLDEPLEVAGEKLSYITFNNYAKYTGYAPAGSTSLTAILGNIDSYDWWSSARQNGAYEREKEALKRRIERVVAVSFPETAGKIEVIDVATPLTYERYTGTWHGSYMGKMLAGSKIKTYPGILKDIKNLFFAGQRIDAPGGLPPALESGRRAVQLLCKEFDTVFQGAL
jgi:phytoene dehydrogenase-like protein